MPKRRATPVFRGSRSVGPIALQDHSIGSPEPLCFSTWCDSETPRTRQVRPTRPRQVATPSVSSLVSPRGHRLRRNGSTCHRMREPAYRNLIGAWWRWLLHSKRHFFVRRRQILAGFWLKRRPNPGERPLIGVLGRNRRSRVEPVGLAHAGFLIHHATMGRRGRFWDRHELCNVRQEPTDYVALTKPRGVRPPIG